ncbi:unnamed protein product [Urochloa humidicola]
MANFPVDPRPFAPRGFEVVPYDPAAPPLRLYAYIDGCYDKSNEDVAIAILYPTVAKEDFNLMAREMRIYFDQVHGVRGLEIQPCPIGEAFVTFSSSLERECFLNNVWEFGEYQMHLIKHYEGVNARAHDLDREAWVMLLNFPLDLRQANHLAKAVAGFGLLSHWHQTNYKARVVVKVYLNDGARIPQAVTMTLGSQPRARSSSFQVYSLRQKDVTFLPDEDPIPEQGPMYPLPFEAPRWMSPVAPGNYSASSVPHDDLPGDGAGEQLAVEQMDASTGDTVNDEGAGTEQRVPNVGVEAAVSAAGAEAVGAVDVSAVEVGQRGKAAAVNPPVDAVVATDPAPIAVISFGPAPPPVIVSELVVAKVTQSLFLPAPRSISSYSYKFTFLDADHSTKIPKYFDDPDMLMHLAKVLRDEDEEPEPVQKEMEHVEEKDEVDEEILDSPPPRSTPRKHVQDDEGAPDGEICASQRQAEQGS